MKLRDYYCKECGLVVKDVCVDSLIPVTVKRPCYGCGGAITKHLPLCNGGLNSRYRFMDAPQP